MGTPNWSHHLPRQRPILNRACLRVHGLALSSAPTNQPSRVSRCSLWHGWFFGLENLLALCQWPQFYRPKWPRRPLHRFCFEGLVLDRLESKFSWSLIFLFLLIFRLHCPPRCSSPPCAPQCQRSLAARSRFAVHPPPRSQFPHRG